MCLLNSYVLIHFFCSSINFTQCIFLKQILKKICDHPFLLTKKAAEDVLEGMDSMTNGDLDMAEKMASHLASLTTLEESHQVQDVSCKITFIVSLLVRTFSYVNSILQRFPRMLILMQQLLFMIGKLGYSRAQCIDIFTNSQDVKSYPG